MEKDYQEKLEKKQYGVYDTSSVQICSWTKKSLRNEGDCYKKKFYGANTHKCMEMTPITLFCSNRCIFCWRPTEYMNIEEYKSQKWPEPKDIVDNLLIKRKKLLNGFGGNDKVSKKYLEDAYVPDHYAISLSGEPLLYPKMPELVRHLRDDRKARTIFIVSNGLETSMIKKLDDEDSLPTQFYISIPSSNEDLFKKINHSLYNDGWKRLHESLEYMKNMQPLKTRKVMRITLIRGLNDSDENLEEFKGLIDKYDFDFIEVKSYMHLGYSQKRLKKKNQYEWDELKQKAMQLETDKFKFEDEQMESLIVLLKNKDSKHTTLIYPNE
ncbi:MAG: 4-demethylwyosine synthase TYW1 [Candidatus Nanoarchaeia archaeon]|nr:4-demethylwyosine synthase TYW1 [Candidatus Nanoarchaeia archaeon]